MEETNKPKRGRKAQTKNGADNKPAEPKKARRPRNKERPEITAENLADYTLNQLFQEIQYWKGEAMKSEALKKENKTLKSNNTRAIKLLSGKTPVE